MAEVGILDRGLEKIVTSNLKELSGVEGNLLSVAKGKEIKTILITSCNDLEGKTISAISMAYALATKANAKVLLVDGNLYSPKIHESFGMGAAPGLSDFFLARLELNDLVRKTGYEGLMIMPCGTDVHNKLDVFESEMLKVKLDHLKRSFDYTIVDSHAVLGSSGPAHIAKYFDGVVFVIECEKTKWEVLQQAKEKIENAGGNILGVVLNRRRYYIPERIYGKI